MKKESSIVSRSMTPAITDRRFGNNQNRPTKVNCLSHHDLFPGAWLKKGFDPRAEKRLYPTLSELDGDIND